MWQPGTAQGLRHLRRAEHAGVVRAAHPRLRRVGAFYRDVFSWDAHDDERHARVPLHDARRGRGPARRDHGRVGVPARRAARRTGRSTSRVDDTDKALAQIAELGGDRARTRARTRRTAAWPRPPTPPARASSSTGRRELDGSFGTVCSIRTRAKERPRMTGTTSLEPGTPRSSSASSSTGPS